MYLPKRENEEEKMIYFIFWGLLYLCAVIDSGTDKKLQPINHFAVYSFIFSYFLILAGFRYKTGYDWQNYMPFFDQINDPTMFKKMDVGYAWLNYFFKNTCNSYSVMIFVVALLCTWGLFKFNNNYSPYPLVSLFIYGTQFFLSYNMGLYRQSIAMTISLLTFHFLICKKNKYAILCCFISFLFHKSAIITLLYFICNKIKLSRKSRLVLLFVSLIIDLFGISIINEIVTLFFSLSFLPKSFQYYSSYLTTMWAAQAQYSTGLGMLIRFSLLLIVFFLKENDSRITNFVFNLVIIGCFIRAFGRNIPIITRLSNYFSMYEMIFYTYIIIICKKYTKQYFHITICSIFLLYFFLNPLSLVTKKGVDGKNNWFMFNPWHSTIFKIEETERNSQMRSFL